ncbi:MAG: type II toxin-antitoxin system PemK/MazF family toxin, partial [Streptococcaceae bacterium]|nr:type II toxin-antitoxin system PemK/MazF family toxin [Streptococcaceae bacterium]
FTDLTPNIGHEQGDKRAVVIVSSDSFNILHPHIRLVVPISTSPKYSTEQFWLDNPWIENVPMNDFGTKGVMLLDHVRSIDMKTRAIRKFGTLKLSNLEAAITLIVASFQQKSLN